MRGIHVSETNTHTWTRLHAKNTQMVDTSTSCADSHKQISLSERQTDTIHTQYSPVCKEKEGLITIPVW